MAALIAGALLPSTARVCEPSPFERRTNRSVSSASSRRPSPRSKSSLTCGSGALVKAAVAVAAGVTSGVGNVKEGSTVSVSEAVSVIGACCRSKRATVSGVAPAGVAASVGVSPGVGKDIGVRSPAACAVGVGDTGGVISGGGTSGGAAGVIGGSSGRGRLGGGGVSFVWFSSVPPAAPDPGTGVAAGAWTGVAGADAVTVGVMTSSTS